MPNNPGTAQDKQKEFYDVSIEDYSSFSWTILSEKVAVKKTDKSVFLHHGTGIPKGIIRDFFLVADLNPGEKRPITLWSKNHRHDAIIEMTSHDSSRTRMMWKSDFSAIIQEKFPDWYEYFQQGEKESIDTPQLKFEKRPEIDEYAVEFIENVESSLKSAFNIPIKPGDVLTNKELMEQFKCSSQGGMRRAHRTNSLVLISDPTKGIYEDQWIDDIFHYTGMGLTGNQSLSFQQNKTLADSKNTDIHLVLFEVFEKGKYVYTGEVELAGKPFVEKQPDIENNIRDVYVFPLKLKDIKTAVPIKQELIEKKESEIRKKVRKLSLEELEFRLQFAQKGVGKREVTTTVYERNQIVAELAKRRANGICQLCDKPAPFKNIDGEPYLETHHFEWLAKGGQDEIDNTVALCPNCHRKVHILNLKSDEAILKSKLSKKV